MAGLLTLLGMVGKEEIKLTDLNPPKVARNFIMDSFFGMYLSWSSFKAGPTEVHLSRALHT